MVALLAWIRVRRLELRERLYWRRFNRTVNSSPSRPRSPGAHSDSRYPHAERTT